MSVCGRFAPTPSGELHAGNILCALLAYLSAKSKGGKFIVRIEDLDAARCPASSAQNMLDMLGALGLESDESEVWQSKRTDAYRAAEGILRRKARIYPCFCSRAQLLAAQAPRLSDGGVVYSGRCKDLSKKETELLLKKKTPCLRIEVPNRVISFTDGAAGEYSQNLATECGDFILRRGDGVYAYQLAVAVDDCESGVTEVVRGIDLISSTPRQLWLMELLGYSAPKYYHIPLVCDFEGRKLSKSEGDGATKLFNKFRTEEILGALAHAAGILSKNRPSSLQELITIFEWKNVRTDKILLPREFL